MKSDPALNISLMAPFILIAILTLINAFFASAEMALVSLNKHKITLLAQQGNKRAKLLVKLLKEPTKFLSTIQIAITLAGFFSSASAATGISYNFAAYLYKFNVPYSEQIALIVITIGLSYITLVFGELFPKRIAMQNSEAVALFSVVPIIYVSKVAIPFVMLLSGSINILIKITGLDGNDLEEKVSKAELRSLVGVGQQDGIINETEKEMINNVFEFDDKLVYEVMIPRTEVFLININDPVKEYLDELLEEKYSRVPVFDGDIDNIVGILYMKDFIIEARLNGFENVDIKKILHSPFLVHESKKIDVLFKELQSSKHHMAILIDEYGGFSGIVTIDDLIEEIMGDIKDEYDDDEAFIKKVDDNTYLVSGLLPLDELNDYLKLKLVSKNFNTIGGFLIGIMGYIPLENEIKTVIYKNITFKIEEVNENRIKKIRILTSFII
ncbi:MAG TPA: hemolysin family protein [Clostridium sp.]|uniref:hemolysin family protein n=1 Tax=Clostridium sp. TaxID=1506 RepID=UPI002F9484E7